MKALTIWQPWASLIMLGAKRHEFRGWDFRTREAGLVGQRIVVHAGARPMKAGEIEDIVERIADGVSALDAKIACPLIERILNSFAETPASRRRRAKHPGPALPGIEAEPEPAPVVKPGQILPLAAALGTAILGAPVKAVDLFGKPTNDSYRADHSMWAWPLDGIEPFDAPVPAKGAQGFWEYAS